MSRVISRLSAAQRDRVVLQLKASLLFSSLKGERLAGVVDRVKLHILKEGDTLFCQGEPAHCIYLLSAGQVKLVRRGSNGAEKVIHLVTPGSTFAEAVIFSKSRTYPVAAVCIEDSVIWSIDGDHYLEELARSTDACFGVLKQVTERLHHQLADIERLSLHTALSRLISYLLAQLPEKHAGNRATIRLHAPKNVIASRLSIVPATFSRSLARLSRDGLLEVHEGNIELLDIERLRLFTHEVDI